MQRALEFLGSKCVFCNNKNLNFLEESFRFKTASECGHRMCSTCFDGPLFRTKKILDCPGCANGQQLKRTQLLDGTKEEIDYQREVKVRKQILSSFNLAREDFPDDTSFAAYQELAEEIVACKLSGRDLKWADAQLEKNEANYRAQIARRAAIRAEADRRFVEEQKVAAERGREELRLTILRERNEKLARQLEKAEGNQVALGELKATTAALLKAENDLRERERKEKLALQVEQGGYLPATLHLDMAALWPPHQAEAQPRKERQQPAPVFVGMDPKDLRKARRLAGGANTSAFRARTQQLTLTGLNLS
jgi:hypothetical protein